MNITVTHSSRYYYLKDHLGNIRVTVNEFGQAEAYNDYYPFGLQMPGRSVNNAMTDDIYKFGGKELDEESGLNWYYFGARYYDPAIGRWPTPDPMSHLYPSLSPYNYCDNNPTNFYDPDGKLFYDSKTKDRISSNTAYNRAKKIIGNALSNKYESTSKNTRLNFYSEGHFIKDLFDGDYSYSYNSSITKIGKLGGFDNESAVTVNSDAAKWNYTDEQTIVDIRFEAENTDFSGNPEYRVNFVNAKGDYLIKLVGNSMEELNGVLSQWGYNYVKSTDENGKDVWRLQKIEEENEEKKNEN